MSDTSTRRGHTLTLSGITQRFGNTVAANNVSLRVAAGELVAFLGPSGCGKTTLLRIIAGFQTQTTGSVLFDDVPVDHLPTAQRGVGIVFQNYALFPHMSVAENIAYGLDARRVPRHVRDAKVKEMLALVRMQAFADRVPRQLSGGQQQRIALGQAHDAIAGDGQGGGRQRCHDQAQGNGAALAPAARHGRKRNQGEGDAVERL